MLDIVSNLYRFLDLDDTRSFGRTNTACHQLFLKHINYDRVVKLNYLSPNIIEFVLQRHKFCKLDLSNTMITDEFPSHLLTCHTIILHHCYNITDAFITQLPCCDNLDISYCTNVTGDFIVPEKRWDHLKLSGCYFINPACLLRLNCDTLDLTNTLLIYRTCNLGTEAANEIFNVLKRCNTIYLSKHHRMTGPVYEHDDVVIAPIMDVIKYVTQHIYISYDDVGSRKILTTHSIYGLLSKRGPLTNLVILPDNNPITSPHKETHAQDVIPDTFSPPGIVSICKNYYYDEKYNPQALLESYESDRTLYTNNMWHKQNDLNVLKEYDFTAPFYNLIRLEDDTFLMHFRKYNPASSGILGPQYRDIDYAPLDFGGGIQARVAGKQYASIGNADDKKHSMDPILRLFVAPEISFLFDHRPILTNQEYFLLHNNKSVYVDIRDALLSECNYSSTPEELSTFFEKIRDTPLTEKETDALMLSH